MPTHRTFRTPLAALAALLALAPLAGAVSPPTLHADASLFDAGHDCYGGAWRYEHAGDGPDNSTWSGAGEGSYVSCGKHRDVASASVRDGRGETLADAGVGSSERQEDGWSASRWSHASPTREHESAHHSSMRSATSWTGARASVLGSAAGAGASEGCEEGRYSASGRHAETYDDGSRRETHGWSEGAHDACWTGVDAGAGDAQVGARQRDACDNGRAAWHSSDGSRGGYEGRRCARSTSVSGPDGAYGMLVVESSEHVRCDDNGCEAGRGRQALVVLALPADLPGVVAGVPLP